MKMEIRRGFYHIKRLIKKSERKDRSIKVLNGSGITVSDEQEVVKEGERLWGNCCAQMGK